MQVIKTVQVKDKQTPQGYRVINAQDFDPQEHELFKPPTERLKSINLVTKGAAKKGGQKQKKASTEKAV